MSARVSASTFTAAAQHPTLPPGYAYFYGGVGGMPGLAGYGNMGATQQLQYPGIPVPTAAGNTSTTQFQNKAAYGSRYTDPMDTTDFSLICRRILILICHT